MTKNSFMSVIVQRLGFVIFLFGKLFRFGFLYFFILFLLTGTKTLAGYSLEETLFFYLTFTLVDTVSQFFFREVYRFRPQVVSGSFDLTLSKPMNALFRSLLGGADVIDLAFLPLILVMVVHFGIQLEPSLVEVVLYILFIVNALVIAVAFHIAVLSLGILTLEIDHTIMIYRDLTSLGRFPVDIYKEPLRGILTFVIPVSIMFSTPAKALIGVLNPQGLAIAFAVAVVFMFLSLKFWDRAVRAYTSASS